MTANEQPKPSIHARRAARSARFHATRARRAENPMDAAARAFDRWRRAVHRLPELFGGPEAEEVTTWLKNRAALIEKGSEDTDHDHR